MSLGGVFPFILMGTFSSLALVLLQHVYLKNACVVHELECMTSSLEWGAASKTGEKNCIVLCIFGSTLSRFPKSLQPLAFTLYFHRKSIFSSLIYYTNVLFSRDNKIIIPLSQENRGNKIYKCMTILGFHNLVLSFVY